MLPKSNKKTLMLSKFISYSLFILTFYYFINTCIGFIGFMCDDSFRSLRYSYRLAHGFGLTWSAGRPVEGYSNLMWVLLNALCGFVGMNLIFSARVLGFVCAFLMFAYIVYHYYRQEKFGVISILAGLICISFSRATPIWTVGGLETPLVALLITIGTLTLFDNLTINDNKKNSLLITGTFFGLLCITRVDGFVFLAAPLFTILLLHGFNKKGLKKSIDFLTLPVALLLLQLIFRLVYYGTFAPNTALVKVSVSIVHLSEGLKYLWQAVSSHYIFTVIFAIISIAFVLTNKDSRIKGIYLTLQYCIWFIYVAVIGGDIFPAYRHFVVIIVLSAITIIEGVKIALSIFKKNIFAQVLIVILLAVGSCFYLQMQLVDNCYKGAAFEKWEWDGLALGTMLGKGFKNEQPKIAVSAAGSLPFASKLPCLDMLGLNDYYLPRHKPANFGNGFIGHEAGDGAYVLSQKPDLIIFGYPYGGTEAKWKSEKELLEIPEFQVKYKLISFCAFYQSKTVTTQAWVNIDEKAGIKRTNDHIEIPGYFLGNQTFIGENNEFYSIVLSYRPPAVVDWVDLEPGKWSAKIEPSPGTRLYVEYGNEPARIRKYDDNGKVLFTYRTGQPRVKIWIENFNNVTNKFSKVILTKL